MHAFSYHEKKQHGTPEFPVAYYRVDEAHPQYQMGFHWHKEWELIRISQGSMVLYADEKEYLAGEGDLFLLQDGMLHGGTPQGCLYECLVFDLHGLFREIDKVKPHLRPFYRSQRIPPVHFPAAGRAGLWPRLDPLARDLMQAFSKPGAELAVLGGVSLLFSALLDSGCCEENAHSSQGQALRSARIKPVLEYIEAHFASPLSLSDLAGAAGMSPKYFCRFFHSITHQTPMEFLIQYRIDRAARLLTSTDMPITSIALECGFADGSYFGKAFKKIKGQAPRSYRRDLG